MQKTGPILRRLRQARALDQGEVARRAGISQAQLSRLERGEGNPTERTLAAVANALGARLLPIPFEHMEDVARLRAGPEQDSLTGSLVGSLIVLDGDEGNVLDDVLIPDPEDNAP